MRRSNRGLHAAHQPGLGVAVDVLEFLLTALEYSYLVVQAQLQLKVQLLDDSHERSEDSQMRRVRL